MEGYGKTLRPLKVSVIQHANNQYSISQYINTQINVQYQRHQ